jgi:hypothetical protein
MADKTPTPEYLPPPPDGVVPRGQAAVSFRTAWQYATPLQKRMFFFLSAGTVASASMFALGQFFQTRGVQSMLTSRIFLIAALLFPVIGMWQFVFLLNANHWKWVAFAVTLLLLAGGYALDRTFPMPKSVETKTPYQTVPVAPTPTTSQPAPIQTTTTKQNPVLHLPAHPLVGPLASTPPFLTLRFFRNAGEPGFSMVNIGDIPATRPKWTIALSDYTNEYYPHYRDDPDSSEPLPIPTNEVDDFVKGHSQAGNFNIFNDTARQIIKPGDQIFGLVAISCMNCPNESKFWFYWTVGNGGWFAPFTPIPKGVEVFKRPNLSSDQIDGLISAIAPTRSRVPIPDGKGAEVDLTQP